MEISEICGAFANTLLCFCDTYKSRGLSFKDPEPLNRRFTCYDVVNFWRNRNF
jgi:hypothetical protein